MSPAPQAAPAAGSAVAEAPQQPARKPAPRVRPKPQTSTPATVATAKKPAAPEPAAPAAVAAAKKPAALEPAARVALLAELPDELRRQVPAMAIGGSVYSPQRASRMLIVNGQVLREGDPVAPELQLEQIGAKAAVFSIRGQRFEVPL